MSAKSKGGKYKEVNSALSKNHKATFKPGDCVLVNPDASAPAYVARIKKVSRNVDNTDDVMLDITWFYRPEEAVGGRKAFHGEAEVFDSDHADRVNLSTVLGHCKVLDIRSFEALDNKTEADFFCRFKYKPYNKEFEPDTVPVYCKCELPYNPDRAMVYCAQCSEWYHPDCLKLSDDVLDSPEDFICPECVAKDDGPRKKQAPSTGAAAAVRR